MNSLCSQIQDVKDYDRFVALMRELSDLVQRKEVRFAHHSAQREWQRNRPWAAVPAVVTKVLARPFDESEKVEISILTADQLFREIRIENTLTSVDGQPVALKNGANVDVIIEADAEATVGKSKP